MRFQGYHLDSNQTLNSTMLLLQSEGQTLLSQTGRDIGSVKRLTLGVSKSCNERVASLCDGYHCLNNLSFCSQRKRAGVLQNSWVYHFGVFSASLFVLQFPFEGATKVHKNLLLRAWH